MAKLNSSAVSMPLKSCLLPHLPGQPKLQNGEFFLMQDEKGELVVCKAKKLVVRGGLPPGMDMSGVAKVDLDGVWICAEYWEAARKHEDSMKLVKEITTQKNTQTHKTAD